MNNSTQVTRKYSTNSAWLIIQIFTRNILFIISTFWIQDLLNTDHALFCIFWNIFSTVTTLTDYQNYYDIAYEETPVDCQTVVARLRSVQLPWWTVYCLKQIISHCYVWHVHSLLALSLLALNTVQAWLVWAAPTHLFYKPSQLEHVQCEPCREIWKF